METKMSGKSNDHSNHRRNSTTKAEVPKSQSYRDVMTWTDLWIDGLICAFEYVRGRRKVQKHKTSSKVPYSRKLENDDPQKQAHTYGEADPSVQNVIYNPNCSYHAELRSCQLPTLDDSIDNQACKIEQFHESRWVPIGWTRLSELVQEVQIDIDWEAQQFEFMDTEDDVTVAELAAPYWERPVGPIWWCHVDASHQNIISWLGNAQWLHPAVSIALRDESRLISERMKYLLYEVPVRVAGGLLFELLGQSAGDPVVEEDDIPVVLRSWQAQNFLVTAMHVKGSTSDVNVLGVMEVQELLTAGGYNAPKTIHEVIAHLTCRLARWDDRFYRKSIFGTADEVELKFVNRRNHEDLHLFGVILNQEIRKLSTQVIRVKWSLHAREEIIFELLHQLRGSAARSLLDMVKKSTRQMLDEQEAVRGRLFTIQDVMQSTIRAWLQDRSLRVTHNLGVIGGCGLVLSIITGLFGINVDGIPGAENTPYAFGLFTALLVVLGAILIGVGLIYLGLKQPVNEEQVEVRKMELEELVKMFQHEAETHAQVRQDNPRKSLPSIARDQLPRDADYVIIQ
ncbi:uncharacterized protein LOC110690207 [Chenopodium quinoa]|uniref:Magnesium transporter CorA-like family protein n=1 Tax=Chenopodium quinoa TaxID=63459 RepID=A0A803MDM7_CHEQI|nr:uncharacterized protein LOC110690207 [Chenopodium quinoa]